MTKINIGKGSSKFYCNLIKAYLKNHENVSVVAGGLRMNLGVWVCYYISKEFKVEKTNVHYTEDDRTHTIFSFDVTYEEPVETEEPKEYTDTLVIRVAKNSSIKNLRTVLYNVNDVQIIAAGGLCYKALFLTTFALKYRFTLQKLDIIWTGDRVGIKIKLYKEPDGDKRCHSNTELVQDAEVNTDK
jgi:hypothetical protein